MTRLFKRYTKRNTYLLDGVWKFKPDPEKVGLAEKWFENFPEDTVDMIIPSCWNNELGLYDYEGLAWYKTTFKTTKVNINLQFHGVTGLCDVYLDGKLIGNHYGGFTGFNITLNNISLGSHTLIIAVNNTHDSLNTIPLSRVDWFHYGGITRSVEIMELEDSWIKDYRIAYNLNSDYTAAVLNISVDFQTFEGLDCNKNFNIYMNDKLIYTETLDIKEKSSYSLKPIHLENLLLWDTENPNLYTIRLEIDNDDVIDRIGFRDIAIEDKQLRLNGKALYLKGVNRHEDHPDWGFALPLKLMKKDIDIIKNLGCNTIRGSHYPNAPIFLDYLDEQGILFWEEIPMWGYPEEPLKNPLILERGLMMHEEMVKRDYHHPAIILWGMHNEVDTRTQAAFTITKAFAEKVRALDNTRPLTYATMFPLDDICYPLVDIVSVNKYFGWYEGDIKGWESFLIKLKDKLKNDNLEHMPIIMSEFGAGAIYGDNTFESPKWTENYQEKYLAYTLNLFYKDKDIIGTYIWQYCDIRTAKELEMGRPRSFNNKGIVNEYRKPKLAYWTVQKIYQSIKDKKF
jgi:beta-glucuronidase